MGLNSNCRSDSKVANLRNIIFKVRITSKGWQPLRQFETHAINEIQFKYFLRSDIRVIETTFKTVARIGDYNNYDIPLLMDLNRTIINSP